LGHDFREVLRRSAKFLARICKHAFGFSNVHSPPIACSTVVIIAALTIVFVICT
jgi:hypothetical protein